MSKRTYPLRLPSSVKTAAAQLAKADGVSLNQFISAAVAEKVGSLRAVETFLAESAGRAKPKDLLPYLRKAPKVAPTPGDELPAGPPPGYVMGGEYTKWLPVRIVMADGKEVRGIRVNEDAFTIQMRDIGNRLVSVDKQTLRSFDRLTGTSIMRSYQSTFTPAELDDVIAYLASLQGRR